MDWFLYIETSPLICSQINGLVSIYRNQSIDLLPSQWSGFYIISASVMKGLKETPFTGNSFFVQILLKLLRKK